MNDKPKTKSDYWHKLQDPRWQKKRLEVMSEHNFACENCGDESSQLNVHHSYYKKNADPWDYENFELKCLCDKCHIEFHRQDETLDSWVKWLKTDRFAIDLAIGYMSAIKSHLDQTDIYFVDNAEFVHGMAAYFHIKYHEVYANELVDVGRNSFVKYEIIEEWLKEKKQFQNS